MIPDTGGLGDSKIPDENEKIDALSGSPGSDPTEKKLMHSVMEHDDEDVKDGKLLAESYDYNLSSFQPDLLFEQLCQNYKTAKKLYGKTLIRELTGYDDEFVEKNINIPEFKEELKQRISQTVEELRNRKLVDKEGQITHEGVRLSALIRYTEELDRLQAYGQGKQELKERAPYGERAETENFHRELHRYRDLDLKKSVKRAIRRGHTTLRSEDLVAARRQQRGKVTIMYAVDASGSMRGPKIRMAKQAGIALAFKAINDKNDVGLLIFTSKIEQTLAPSKDFMRILESLSVTRAGLETDIALSIEEAIKILHHTKGAKHLVLLTDAMPTKTKENIGPRRRVLEAVSSARGANITISLVGIGLDKDGESLAQRMTEIGGGKLYIARDAGELDAIILEDYEMVKNR